MTLDGRKRCKVIFYGNLHPHPSTPCTRITPAIEAETFNWRCSTAGRLLRVQLCASADYEELMIVGGDVVNWKMCFCDPWRGFGPSTLHIWRDLFKCCFHVLGRRSAQTKLRSLDAVNILPKHESMEQKANKSCLITDSGGSSGTIFADWTPSRKLCVRGDVWKWQLFKKWILGAGHNEAKKS